MLNLPPLNALKSFEVAARTGSYVAAAAELNVSPAAISQQVRNLEVFLKRKLFTRLNNRVILTDAGQAIYAGISPALEEIAALTQRVLAGSSRAKLVVSVIPSLAECWFMPALADFAQAAALRIDLRVENGPVDFAQAAATCRSAASTSPRGIAWVPPCWRWTSRGGDWASHSGSGRWRRKWWARASLSFSMHRHCPSATTIARPTRVARRARPGCCSLSMVCEAQRRVRDRVPYGDRKGAHHIDVEGIFARAVDGDGRVMHAGQCHGARREDRSSVAGPTIQNWAGPMRNRVRSPLTCARATMSGSGPTTAASLASKSGERPAT